MIRTMEGPGELWRMRKQFALQLASNSFMTYVLYLSGRLPYRFHLSRATGQMVMSELLPGQTFFVALWMIYLMPVPQGVSTQAPLFASNDSVPFRFTPNMQTFLGPVFTEGVLTSGLVAIGRSLTEPEVNQEPFSELVTHFPSFSSIWNNNFACLDEMKS
jgi:transformation/transcription domain-associated protein